MIERAQAMRRRLLGALLAAPLVALAKDDGRVYRIGTLAMGVATEPNNISFTQALRELGYVEGKNIVIERRFAGADPGKLTQLAGDLASLGLDLIHVSATAPTQAVKNAAGKTPVVFVNVADPVGSGFVASLARPGGSATGISVIATELSAKRMQLLKQAFPAIKRLAVLVTNEPIATQQLQEVERAARAMNVEVKAFEIAPGTSGADAQGAIVAWKADSLYFTETSQNLFNRQRLTALALALRLPAMFGANPYAEAGGMMSYGSNYEANYRRAAVYVDKILKGAKPADLPVEQPTVFELILNMKTAKSLGLAFPETILVRAEKTLD